MFERLRLWARTLKRDVLALWIAARDARTPRLAKIIAIAVAGYAFSPIDVIPDFVPVLGYLDDLIILPAGIALAIRLIPSDLMAEFRLRASSRMDRPRSYVAMSVIVLIWLAAITAVGVWLFGVPQGAHE
jgi:uncharacterized membrane protein YkvA (DUF1232 family)